MVHRSVCKAMGQDTRRPAYRLPRPMVAGLGMGLGRTTFVLELWIVFCIGNRLGRDGTAPLLSTPSRPAVRATHLSFSRQKFLTLKSYGAVGAHDILRFRAVFFMHGWRPRWVTNTRTRPC